MFKNTIFNLIKTKKWCEICNILIKNYLMKTLKLIIFTLLIFTATFAKAQSSKDYDKTIDRLIPKAKKNKLNEKQLNTLMVSYHEANEIDHKTIMKLKESGQPEIWIEIFYRLTEIDARQDKINVLSEEIKSAMNFKHLDLENEINNSKEKAELFIYAKTKHLLKDINENNLKEAHWLVNQLCKINPQSSNIEELKLKLAIMPSERILFRVATSTELFLPDNFAQLVLDFDDNNIYGVPFDIVPNENINYDLMILIMIGEKKISPEHIETIVFEEKKDDLVAKVTDKRISKSAFILGQIEFIDVKNERLLIKTPFDIGSTFVQHNAKIDGDMAACSEQTLQLSNIELVDFPSDEALLKDCARKLNQVIKNIF